ncbi:hypothetical protein FHY55_11255 [Oceanicola sp. D3]|uniref:hypothetical protein n=1 Tax=Oceanicola sp. D3 TaxID=2587163 RepID=UPI001124238E|nr:hypothetical protein [Oceanicola sp. D3]QDC09787.1 hypothetical protein FHY55_11255 [Oceanicola sp. D3]
MSQIDILGTGPDGLRIGLGPARALVPNALLAREINADYSTAQAEEWAAAMSHDLTEAMTALTSGKSPDAPYNMIQLEREA